MATVENFTTAGTGSWVCPAGVTSVQIEGIGGGAAGGAYAGGLDTPQNGGGGGGYSKKTMTVTPGNSYSYRVGAGGTGGTNQFTDSTSGESTYFVNTSTFNAGGGGYNGQQGGTIFGDNSVGDITYNGGSGGGWSGDGRDHNAGGGGGAAGSAGDGGAGGTGDGVDLGYGGSGAGADPTGGNGGHGAYNKPGSGSYIAENGTAPGGAGGGAATGVGPNVAAEGSAGMMRLTYTVVAPTAQGKFFLNMFCFIINLFKI